ncbi:NAD-dependent succinate-semialdehyde dehydrogenase [Mesobaculum littorinae]|uniref:NAD-dependent succinate-semialdehyde dehydrogenase n=1 Tax=Mesobaculum littorinae TaxID=2486419 RepID=A0A438AK41_9RHOB|nr:NAD-dependent succinate-semialdehyde dehydrogenase [Mesobaculum littorinae]RVV99019.1 NAD-dependent succinate-semialdehyde dehydrogenase [Mesobaculum littorinae]
MTDTITTINPATGKTLDSYSYMSDDEARGVVDACHEAFLGWKALSAEQRGDAIRKVGAGLKARKDELVKLMTAEMGKLESQSAQEIDLCVGICDWTAENGPAELADDERVLPNGGKGVVHYSPIGVIYGIQPWNFPAYQVVRYSIANLMAGNGVLLKHAESVTGSAMLLQEIYDAALPKGLFGVLRISHDQSDAIIDNDKVRGVTLTGSPTAGSIVAKKAGEKLKKTVLELGSNDAYIVLEDADIDQAVQQCVLGRVYNNGETCVAAKRFIVVDAVYDRFRDAFVKAMSDVKAGDPTSDDTDLGPMAREDLRDKLADQVKDSVARGAKVLCGGEVPEGPGFFYPATVLEDVATGQPAYDDELFGPVAALIRATDADDAIRIANDSRFGLGGGIFSQNEERAIALAAEHFDTGMVFVNGFGVAQPNMPFGGVKDSGYGREHGGFGIKEFVNAKAINVMG